MNTRTIVIIGSVVVIALIAFVIWGFMATPSSTPSTGSSSVGFPSAGTVTSLPSGTPSISVAAIQQGSIQVKDFKNNPNTVKDPYNTGYYDIAGGSEPGLTNASFHIFYDDAHQYFGISLLSEPLGYYRKQAEQLLLQTLGISQEQMCQLNYSMGVGPDVNEAYAGKNLGFSFCPSATVLPL